MSTASEATIKGFRPQGETRADRKNRLRDEPSQEDLDRIAADLEEDPQQRVADQEGRKILTGLAILALLVLVAVVAVMAIWASTRSTASPAKGVASATPAATALAGERDPRFVQQDVGFGEAHRVIAKGLEGETGGELRDSALEFAGHSADVLAVYASESGLWDDPNKVAPLLTKDKTYLSEEGIGLWHALNGAWTAKGTKSESTQASSAAYNSGVERSTYGVAASAGIRGDRKSVTITFKDGSSITILKRCGNVTHNVRPPGRKSVKTDNPPPKPGKPGKPDDGLNPKSGDKTKYKRPGDGDEKDSGTGEKPPVTVDGPADDKPPTVDTAKPGGGGVVDKPSNTPGSESGVTAPGADPPSTTPSNPPPNEGGDNDGEVDGF